MTPARRRPAPEKPRWPYFGAPQKRLLFAGFGMWIGTALPWLIIRPFGITRYASPLAASWILWAGLMVLAGAVARWKVLALASAVMGGGTALVISGWQMLTIVDRCQLDSVVRLRCGPGPGLFILVATAIFVLLQSRRLGQLLRST